MAWTKASRKAHGEKISASWARKRAAKEAREAWGKSVILDSQGGISLSPDLDPEDQAAWNRLTRDAVDAVPPHLKVMDLKYNPHFEAAEENRKAFVKWGQEEEAREEEARQDMVNHPSHYTFSEYEVADVADAWYPDEPHLWNANKYMARWNKKGDPVENLEKAIWYLKRKLNILKEQQDGKSNS